MSTSEPMGTDRPIATDRSTATDQLTTTDQLLANAVGLAAQRYALRCELARQRQLLLRQWRQVDDQGEPIEQSHFPRSAIMRFVCGRKATTLLTQIVAWQLGRRYPGLLFWKK